MSYEGYEQLLCKNGHSRAVDAMETMYGYYNPKTWRCICGAKLAWFNCVDQTNESFDKDPDTGQEVRIDGYVELETDKKAVTITCEHCNHIEVIEEETFKVPEEGGHRI